MVEQDRDKPQDDVVISAEALHKAEEFIEEEEGASNRFGGGQETNRRAGTERR